MTMALSIIQVIISVLLVVLILLQDRSSGLSGVFGGGGEFYQTRRSMERILFSITIVFIALFVGLSLINLIA